MEVPCGQERRSQRGSDLFGMPQEAPELIIAESSIRALMADHNAKHTVPAGTAASRPSDRVAALRLVPVRPIFCG